MNWTSELPTSAGWYCIRFDKDICTHEYVLVQRDGTGYKEFNLYVYRLGKGRMMLARWDPGGWEWYGPLEPPKE